MSEPQENVSEPQANKPRSKLVAVLKVVLVLAVAVVGAFLIVGFFVLSGKYDVSREIVIQAPPEAIHKQVGDLREWPNWLPFTKHDKSVEVSIDKPTGVGARQHWTSKDGEGELTFTRTEERHGIEYTMLFDEKWASAGSLTYAPSGGETRVTWRMTGQNDDFVGKWMALAMDAMVGPMFEEGLADLKAKVEAK
jgi:uncharacterized protein YndB with AHSA1/START domain